MYNPYPPPSSTTSSPRIQTHLRAPWLLFCRSSRFPPRMMYPGSVSLPSFGRVPLECKCNTTYLRIFQPASFFCRSQLRRTFPGRPSPSFFTSFGLFLNSFFFPSHHNMTVDESVREEIRSKDKRHLLMFYKDCVLPRQG